MNDTSPRPLHKRPQPGPRKNPLPAMLPGQQFFLHVGVHKTGTTALQKFLYDNQKRLGKQGIHRLQTGLQPDNPHSWGNHDLAWTLRDQDSKGLWPAAAEEAKPYQTIVASSEEFSSIKQAKRYKPTQAAMGDFTMRPICYLRRQDQLLESTYNFHVKSLGETKPIMEFAERILKRLDFDNMIKCLEANFGHEAIIVRVYDSEHLQGDIFDDFMATIGVPEPEKLLKPKKTLNPGLTREGLDKMLEANRTYQDDPDRLKVTRAEILDTYAAPTWTEHETLTPVERRTLMRQFRPGQQPGRPAIPGPSDPVLTPALTRGVKVRPGYRSSEDKVVGVKIA